MIITHTKTTSLTHSQNYSQQYSKSTIIHLPRNPEKVHVARLSIR